MPVPKWLPSNVLCMVAQEFVAVNSNIGRLEIKPMRRCLSG